MNIGIEMFALAPKTIIAQNRLKNCPRGIEHWALDIEHWALDIEHWALRLRFPTVE